MNQSSALRKLEIILDEAVNNGKAEEVSGVILLQAMKLPKQPENIIDFYELLKRAEREGTKINNVSRIDRYIKVLKELHSFCVTNHLWNTKWSHFVSYIRSRNILNSIDALANYFSSQNPQVFLEEDFINNLYSEFDSLLNQVIESDLSQEFKKSLVNKLGEIIEVLHQYSIDVTGRLATATKLLVSDLVTTEPDLINEDKENKVYKKVKAWAVSLALFLTPTPYDIIGTVPDIYEFWVPTFDKLLEGEKKIEKIVDEEANIQSIIEKAKVLCMFSKEPRKAISGNEQKALPPSKLDVD